MINENYFILIMVLLCVGTVLIRGTFIAFSSQITISPKVKQLFTYIPAAIIPGLIVPATFFHQGAVELIHGKERFVILILSCGACFFIRNTLFIISFGLGLLYLANNL